MKLASVLVVLALVILPLGIRFSYLLTQLLTKGTMATESSYRRSPRFERFRSQHKVRFYMLLSSYGLLLFAAVCWMFYEVIAPRFDLPMIGIVWVFSLMVVEAAVIGLSTMQQQRRILGKLPPRPEAGSPNEVIQEWQVKYFNETANNYFRRLIPPFLIALGIFIIWIVLLWLYTIFL